MLISFVIALKSVTGMKIAMPVIVKQLRKEMLTKYDFYRQFSSADVNILQELELFSDNPLVYYNSNTAVLYLVLPHCILEGHYLRMSILLCL